MAFQPGKSGNPAGRPRKADRYAAPVAQAEDRIADRLPKLVATMLRLAEGGYTIEEEEYQPAGLVEIGQGEGRMLAYPDKPADELVLVKRRRRKAAPDRKAAEYLIDRILGRPTQQVEAEVQTSTGGELREAFLAAVDQVYGAKEAS